MGFSLKKISKGLGNVVGDVVGGITGATAQASAAKKAAGQQVAMAQQGIAGLQPYQMAGLGGLTAFGNLAGLNGAGAQQTAIDGITAGPQFQSLLAQGNNSILQNASATGGLRGGNVQSALAQFSPALLSQLIQQQLGTFGSLANSGQSAAGGIAELLGGAGAAQAGGTLAAGNRNANVFGQALGLGSLAASLYGGAGGLSSLFGSKSGGLTPGTVSPGGYVGMFGNYSIPGF